MKYWYLIIQVYGFYLGTDNSTANKWNYSICLAFRPDLSGLFLISYRGTRGKLVKFFGAGSRIQRPVEKEMVISSKPLRPQWIRERLPSGKNFGCHRWKRLPRVRCQVEKCRPMELISSKLAYEKCPQEVIDFYEKHCTWHTIH